jgi:hypothetical protein
MLRSVNGIRYVTPLREGGSLPAIVESDDGKMYVVKFRGAGQGALALVAELISGEIARLLGLRVPEIVFVQIDFALGRNEPDAEIRDLLKASVGQNIGLEYLPGATTFDPAAGDEVASSIASLCVWLDAFVLNVDRTARNANLLLSEEKLWLIDHGASLYFHHNWPTAKEKAGSKFESIREHILLRWAGDIAAASHTAHASLTETKLNEILQLLPDEWLVSESDEVTPSQRREAYRDFLLRRLEASNIFEQEIVHARSQLV